MPIVSFENWNEHCHGSFIGISGYDLSLVLVCLRFMDNNFLIADWDMNSKEIQCDKWFIHFSWGLDKIQTGILD